MVDFLKGHCSNYLLGSWALIAHAIISKFLLDYYSFLLEVIGESNLRPLPFQTHLNSTWKLLPLRVIACVPLFEQLVKRSANCLQESISERLHDHSFINILFNLTSNLYWTCLKSCEGSRARCWHLVVNSSNHFFFPSTLKKNLHCILH
jgi:hypothetical protein